MYVLSTGACGMPNSETPITQAEIDAQAARVASVATAFDNGNQTLNDLIVALGGNPTNDFDYGDAGVATTGTLNLDLPGIPVVPNVAPVASVIPTLDNPSSWSWAPSPPQLLPGGGSGFRNPQGKGRRYFNRSSKRPNGGTATGSPMSNAPLGTCPAVVPMVGLGQDSAAQQANAGIFSNAFEYVIAGLVSAAAVGIFAFGRKRR